MMSSVGKSFIKLFSKYSLSNNNAVPMFNHKILNSTISCDVNGYVKNKNPRNLERLRIARKPTGYHLDKPGRTFWHKLIVIKKVRYVAAKVMHNNGNTVVQASTNEWSISKHLYRCNDTNAYINLAKILADRCLESGIYYMINGVEFNSEKINAFINNFENAGIILCEPPTYKPLTPWSIEIDDKPWKVHLE